MNIEFNKFPAIKRLKRGCVITEKLDGTNAQIYIVSEFEEDLLNDIKVGDDDKAVARKVLANGDTLIMFAGSRNRFITPDDDNYGFASWVEANCDKLFDILGVGLHYGEWGGKGIQRRYALEQKRFSLFNTGRWNEKQLVGVDQLSVVPVLYSGEFTTDVVDDTLANLSGNSVASPGFSNPEGIVVYHTQIKQQFKVTFEHDTTGKPLV